MYCEGVLTYFEGVVNITIQMAAMFGLKVDVKESF